MSDSTQLPDDVLACPPESFAVAAYVKLRRFAQYMAARFNAPVYLVGSALRKANPRDIDVRIVLSEKHFKARYGQTHNDWLREGPSQAWIDEIGKFCEQESTLQRLCIDFQVMVDRNAVPYIGQPRVLLAGPSGAVDAAEALRAADYALADSMAAPNETQADGGAA
jgi:hypothetical protein